MPIDDMAVSRDAHAGPSHYHDRAIAERFAEKNSLAG